MSDLQRLIYLVCFGGVVILLGGLIVVGSIGAMLARFARRNSLKDL